MDTRKGPWFIIFSLLFLCFYTHLSIGASIISAGESISGDQTIISEGDGKFELGFFTPGNSQKHYIGIWYRKIRDQTIVWVANREQPLSNKYSSELKLLEDGNLVLFNSSKIPIWSTNLKSTTSNSTEAVLLDTGNFVLRNRLDSLNSSPFLWESFDYPTDTFLPGGKLGLNKITYKSTLLTSWRNREDPAPGMFSLQLDPAGTSQYHILWNRSKIYWTSGTWNGHIFSLVPEMRLNYIFNFTYVSNEEENYFYYTLYNTSIISRLVMDLSGQIHQLSWYEDIGWNLFWSQPRQQCEVHALCGAFGFCTEIALPFCGCLPGFEPRFPIDYLNLSDRSAGCERRFPLQCMNQASVNWKQLFVRMPNMKFPQNAQFLAAGTAEDCESACSNSCPCTAYAYGTGGCSVWNEDLLNAEQLSDGDTGGGDLYIKLTTSKLPDTKQQSDQRRRLLSIVVPVSTVIGILSLGIFICFWRRRMFNQQGFQRAEDILRDNGNKDLNVAFFDFRSIAFATSNFSDSNKLGQGGFGPVYKGKLSTGQEIAVKRLSKSSGQGLEEFKNEVILIAKLQHRNLVKLIGYCIQGDEKMLLYEYMLNKSLDYFLFGLFLFFRRPAFIFVCHNAYTKNVYENSADQNRRSLLDWERRLTIVLGIARGLLYLHQDSRLRIIHRDLKASNILLDEDMNPKISDFGLARMFEGNQTQANTNRVVGTYGYMSPEYALYGLFSVKSDVFSFGILLLEIISGKKNTGFYYSEHSLSLLGYAWRVWREEKGLELMDPLLNEDNNVQDVLKCIHVGLLCVQEDAQDRPTMATVVAMLISETVNLPTPKQPAFYIRRSLSTVGSSSSGPENCSKNEITLSDLEAR